MYYLLGTSGCHLCELAEDQLQKAKAQRQFDHEEVDIAIQTEWQNQFAMLIPVIYHVSSGHYLNWPFSDTELLTFIDQHEH